VATARRPARRPPNSQRARGRRQSPSPARRQDVYHGLLHQARAGRDVAATARERAADPAQRGPRFTGWRRPMRRDVREVAGEQPSAADELTTDDLAAESDRLAAQAPDPVAARTPRSTRLDRRRPCARGRRGREALAGHARHRRRVRALIRAAAPRLGGRQADSRRSARDVAGIDPAAPAGWIRFRASCSAGRAGRWRHPVVADWADALGIGATIGAVSATEPDVDEALATKFGTTTGTISGYGDEPATSPGRRRSTACRGGSDRSLPAGHPREAVDRYLGVTPSGRPTGSTEPRGGPGVRPRSATTVALSQGQAEDSPARGHDQSGSARARRSDLSARLPGHSALLRRASSNRNPTSSSRRSIARDGRDLLASSTLAWWRSLGAARAQPQRCIGRDQCPLMMRCPA